MPYNPVTIGNTLVKATRNAGRIELKNQQLGIDASPFDVWTHSYHSMTEQMREFVNDPVGAFQQYASAPLTIGSHSESASTVGSSMAAQFGDLGDRLDDIAEAEGGLATVGATFALLVSVEQLLSTTLSMIPFPSLPALRVMDLDIGLPHAHSHPPNLIGVPPPIPLPNAGPIIPIPLLSGAVRTLINGMPAARCGDMGLAIWCGGYFPMYEVFLGSSNVWIEGGRAGRIAVDITRHCVFSAPKPSDPPIGPMIGLPVSASTNVYIGGIPLPSLLSLATGNAIRGLLKGLRKAAPSFSRAMRGLRQRIFSNIKPGFLKCSVLRAEPVNAVTGEVVVEQQDFDLPWRIPLDWTRRYRSGSTRIGVCGLGWETPADARLERDDDGVITFYDGAPGAAVFPRLPDDGPVMEFVDGAVLEAQGDHCTVRTKQGLTYHFPRLRPGARETLVAHVTDRCGNFIEFIRSGGALEQIRESSGIRIQVTSVAGRIHRMLLHHPLEERPRLLVQYEYDREDLITVRDALGHPYRFAYDNHRMVRHTNRMGLSFYYEFDGRGLEAKCVRSWGDGGLYNYRFEYTEGSTRYTDSLGHRWAIEHSEGLITREIDPAKRATTYVYDTSGRTIEQIDPLDHRTRYEYDERGNLTGLTWPDGTRQRMEYDEDNRVLAVTDAQNATWTFTWDRRRLLSSHSSPRGAAWRYDYNGSGDMVAVINPLGHRFDLETNPSGAVVGMRDADGWLERLTVDAFGNVTARYDERGRRTAYHYDAKGRLTTTVHPDDTVEAYAHDAEDHTIAYRDAGGYVTSVEYGGLGAIQEIIRPDGSWIRYDYDSEERVVAIHDSAQGTFRFGRDLHGRITVREDPLGAVREFLYDAAGRLVELRGKGAMIAEFELDSIGKVQEVRYADGQWERFAYDANGNLTGAANAAGTVKRQFDEDGNVVREQTGAHAVESRYDLLGQLVEYSLSSGDSVGYGYDPRGGLREVRWNHRPIWTLNSDGTDDIVEALGPVKRTSRIDERGRRVHERVTVGAAIEIDREYGYDPSGNRVLWRDSNRGTRHMRFDALGRIVAESRSDAGDEWSAVPTSTWQSGMPSTVTMTGQDGWPTRIDRTDGTVRLEWSAAGELRQAWATGGERIEFEYDALGRRVAKVVDGVRHLYHWNGDLLVGEEDATGDVTRYVYRSPGEFVPLAVDDGRLRVYLTDPVGLPLEVLNLNDGELVWSGDYDSLGRLTSETLRGFDNRLRLQGQYWDPETHLCQTRFRYFEPATGAFLTPDPLGLGGGDLFGYAPNVWTWIDPYGLACRIQGVFPDTKTKGIHINASNGVELRVLPGKGGTIVFKRVFSKDPPKSVREAVAEATEDLADPDFVRKLHDTARRATEYLATNGAPAKSGETWFLQKAIEKLSAFG